MCTLDKNTRWHCGYNCTSCLCWTAIKLLKCAESRPVSISLTVSTRCLLFVFQQNSPYHRHLCHLHCDWNCLKRRHASLVIVDLFCFKSTTRTKRILYLPRRPVVWNAACPNIETNASKINKNRRTSSSSTSKAAWWKSRSTCLGCISAWELSQLWRREKKKEKTLKEQFCAMRR